MECWCEDGGQQGPVLGVVAGSPGRGEVGAGEVVWRVSWGVWMVCGVGRSGVDWGELVLAGLVLGFGLWGSGALGSEGGWVNWMVWGF